MLFAIENKAFLNQLNPHFLFNALNTLQDYLIEKDTHNGIVYLQRISAIARTVLQFNRSAKITVQQEISFLDKYLFVQQKRYSDKFTYQIIATPDVRECTIPPMLLQPIVENAIEHGLANKKGDGEISVHFKAQQHGVVVTITDNGDGIFSDIVPLNDGHALFIINERLNYINKIATPVNNYISVQQNTPAGIIVNIAIPTIH